MRDAEIQNIISRARKGHATELNLLGLMYLAGDGVEKDALQAAACFRAAAGKELAEGQFNYAELLRIGLGVALDPAEARLHYERAGLCGIPDAQFALGQMHEFGQGGPENAPEAARWYRLAAEQDHTQALLFLGGLYVEGNGVPRDMGEAYFLFGVAARIGDPNAEECRDTIAARMTPQQLKAAEARVAAYEPNGTFGS